MASTDNSLVIEDQYRLCDSDENIIEKLNLKTNSEKNQNIYHLETADKIFKKNGWSIRFRERDDNVELTVKHHSESYLNNHPDLKDIECEYDLHEDVKEYSCKLNSKISIKDFNRLKRSEIHWTDLLTSDEFNWLNQNQLLIDANLWGFQTNRRFKINYKNLKDITIDLIHLQKRPDLSFHEISVRFTENNQIKRHEEFINFLKNTGVFLCTNQNEWEVDKYQYLEIYK